MKFKVSVVQMDILFGDPEGNIAKAIPLIRQSAENGAKVVVLPELWTTGYSYDNLREVAASHMQATAAAISKSARDNRLYIIGSTVEIKDNALHNTCSVVGPRGLIGQYSKVHLFRLLDEDKFFRAGNSYSVYKTELGIIGTAICYDIRFPELCRSIALAEAGVLFVPAEWPYPRISHWRNLLIARAIENQMFVVGCNRVGTDKKSKYFGHSLIADPAGEVIVEGGESEELLTGELDFEKLHAMRKLIPCYSDRSEVSYSNRVDFEEKSEQLNLQQSPLT